MSSYTQIRGDKIMNLNEISTRTELADFLEIPIHKLTYILYVKHPHSYYETFEIPKKNGELRTIHAPKKELKYIQTKLLAALSAHVTKYNLVNATTENISHAFKKNKSIFTNASYHKDKRYILNVDLKDYFEHFHFGRVRGYFHKNKMFCLPIEIATIIAQLTCYNGSLPQGAPTSPIITNLICNILDMHIIKLARKYGLHYTRYADDMTFSTNRKDFPQTYISFLNDLKSEIESFGFEINENKTRLIYNTSRQEVTGLVVNKKVNVCKSYYKETRAMAHRLYTTGSFQISDIEGTINQLNGRFSFINQADKYNNSINIKLHHEKPHRPEQLKYREKDYQYFLFYQYFYANEKPLIVTEGKTDIVYLKSALKKYYKDYPSLIKKEGNKFEFNVSFLNKTKRLSYFLGINQDGADTMKNIYNLYTGAHNYPHLNEYFYSKSKKIPTNPVLLVFDNEQKSTRPLKTFLSHIKQKEQLHSNEAKNIVSNLYIITNPLVRNKEECEIEDLFDDATLSHTINGKTFSRDDNYDTSIYYGKSHFANYISSDYLMIDFENFKPFLDVISKTIDKYKKDSVPKLV